MEREEGGARDGGEGREEGVGMRWAGRGIGGGGSSDRKAGDGRTLERIFLAVSRASIRGQRAK